MCTNVTTSTMIHGSAKGPEGNWIRLTDAHVYFDHPQHSISNHALIVDLIDADAGPSARVAVELNTESALRLVAAIQETLSRVDKRVLADS
jgi:hypothetical protein